MMFLHSHVERTNTTDRERILHALVIALRSAASRLREGETDGGHFAHYAKAQVGDLVIGLTGCQIGVVVERPTSDYGDGWMIRPVGLEKSERWSNEGFTVIRALRSHDLLIGKQAELWQRVRRKCGEIQLNKISYLDHGKPYTGTHEVRAADIAFDDADSSVAIFYRPKFSQALACVTIFEWRKIRSIKALRAAIVTGLEGREFIEPTEPRP